MNPKISLFAGSRSTLALYAAYALIILIAMYLYSPSLHFNYVWDDASMVFKRADFLRDDWFNYLLTEPFFISPNYYRPLATFALYLDFRLGGANPAISHAVNLAIFMFNLVIMALLLKAIAKKLLLSEKETLLICSAALLFYCLHTSMIESVAWVSGRFDLMVTSFILLALLFDTAAKTTLARAAGTATCFLLAALCKEMAVVFLPVLVLWHYLLGHSTSNISLKQYLHSTTFRSHLPVYIAIFGAGLAYLAIRRLALGYILLPPTSHYYGEPANHIATVFKAIFLYWQMLLLPFLKPSVLYQESYPVATTDHQAFLGLILVCFTSSLCLLRQKKGVLATLLVLLIFLTSISPIIHIATMTIGDNIIHQRFLTLPVSLFSLTLLPLFKQLKDVISRSFKLFLSATSLAYLLCSIISLNSIVPLWKNDLSLWAWAYKSQGSETAALNLADALFRNGRYQEAYDLASLVKIQECSAALRMAEAALAMRRFEEAKQLFLKAVQLPDMQDSNKPVVYANIAYLKILTNDFNQTEELLKRSLNRVPTASRTHFYYALFYYKQADFANAHRYLNNAIKYSMGEPQFQNSYRSFQQKFTEAETEYRKTGQLAKLFDDE